MRRCLNSMRKCLDSFDWMSSETLVNHIKAYHFNPILPLSSSLSSPFQAYFVCNQATDLALCSASPKYSQWSLVRPYPLPLSSLLRHSWTFYPGNLCNQDYLDLRTGVNDQQVWEFLPILRRIFERRSRYLSIFRLIDLNSESFER